MLVYLLLLPFVGLCDSYPDGKVEASCVNMVPAHGVDALSSAVPYTIVVDKNSYTYGDTVTGTTLSIHTVNKMPNGLLCRLFI